MPGNIVTDLHDIDANHCLEFANDFFTPADGTPILNFFF
jgi:hypothetical protein